MAGKPKDITGQRYGRLVAVTRTEEKAQNGSYIWECVCDCGNNKNIALSSLSKGSTRSCGCLAKEQLNNLILSRGGSRHNFKNKPVYRSWSCMLSRAKSNDLKNYEDVTVCDRWCPDKGGSFINFLEDMGEPPEGYSLNRIRGAKIYSKETCEWADRSLQGYDQKKSSKNKTGKTGVHKTKSGKFRAKITKNKQSIFLGEFSSLEDAIEARKEAELKYFGFTKE